MAATGTNNVNSDIRHKDSRVLIVIQDIVKHLLVGKALVQDIQGSLRCEQELNELYRDVQKTIHLIRTNIEELELLGKEQDRETEQEEIYSDVINFRKQLNSLQQVLRKANLEAQVALEKKARSILLEDDKPNVLRERTHKNKETAAKMSSDITTNLLSISRALASQVVHSEDSLQTLGGSGRSIRC